MIRFFPYLLILGLIFPVRAVSGHQQEPASGSRDTGTIYIGLLLPDRSQSYLIPAAELAIEQANADGGYRNREFRLSVRTAEGFWGAGSKESVKLVYEDQVRAIIGSLDGRNGHLAEQVATKSHLPYIETQATEPTLSQAFVPWFKRVVPNDNQQAEVIIEQIRRNGGGSIGILSREDYDTRYAVRSLSSEAKRRTGTSPRVIDLDSNTIKEGALVEKILDSRVDHLVIPFNAGQMGELIQALREEKPELDIYGTLHLAMGAENGASGWGPFEGVYLVRPPLGQEGSPASTSSRSAYLYDAVCLVINAIQHVGTVREKISEYLSGSAYSKGITGSISFDELGNRQDAASLVRIQQGVPMVLY